MTIVVKFHLDYEIIKWANNHIFSDCVYQQHLLPSRNWKSHIWINKLDLLVQLNFSILCLVIFTCLQKPLLHACFVNVVINQVVIVVNLNLFLFNYYSIDLLLCLVQQKIQIETNLKDKLANVFYNDHHIYKKMLIVSSTNKLLAKRIFFLKCQVIEPKP